MRFARRVTRRAFSEGRGMEIRKASIDEGQGFDFGKTAQVYAKYRDIYPACMYERLAALGIGVQGQHILDLGTGTGVLPRGMYAYGRHE